MTLIWSQVLNTFSFSKQSLTCCSHIPCCRPSLLHVLVQNILLVKTDTKKAWSHSVFSVPSVCPTLINGPTLSLNILLILAYSAITPYVPQYFYLKLGFGLSDFAQMAQAILFVFLLCCLVSTSCVFLCFSSSRSTLPSQTTLLPKFHPPAQMEESSFLNSQEDFFEKQTFSLCFFFPHGSFQREFCPTNWNLGKENA